MQYVAVEKVVDIRLRQHKHVLSHVPAFALHNREEQMQVKHVYLGGACMATYCILGKKCTLRSYQGHGDKRSNANVHNTCIKAATSLFKTRWIVT